MSQSEAQNPGDGTSSHQGREGRRDRAARLAAKRHSGRPDAADPHFSQPVRQIVLMLIVLVLVGMGTWFAYRQILPIFAANPALNGAILLVFVLGVLTCFWQVGQLVHSVSWIERFAAGKFGYGPLDQTAPERPPRLLAPLAALLGARGPMGGAISTESARSIQDSVATRIDEARDITRYLANLLIFLGLLGTFYGLATTVPAIVETIRTLAPGQGESGIEVFDKLMHGLETQLGGMATAFSSSLLGLAGSLIVGLLELFASHGQNRFYRELEEWLSGFTRIGMSGEGGEHVALAEFLQGVSGQIAGLQDFYAARDVLRDEEAADADSRSMALAAGVQQLTQLVGSDRDALAGQVALERQVASDAQSRLAQMVERLADGQDRLLVAVQAGQGGDSRLEDLTSGLEQAFTSLIERQDRLIALAAQPTAMPPEMAQALERITESQQRLALAAPQPAASGDGAAARALARLADGQARLVELAEARPGAAQDDPEARMRLRSIDVQLGRLVEEAASGRDGLIAELREDMAALTRAIRALEARDGA
ncbi:hypothetical protein [Paracoccus shanxieyensis]|uniref:Biopolymer transporter ExbB n=1 Tax=Paracoccus shanxieyensis TaxID=2675752 RepID=A0A6L6J242_9RHOB|nr:hypothetical protein [Paracoccus shanxieyensis]MTH64777.1 hypothetical protein [Paracoccus shanxieyensis]MTH87990.1 hypothetical protein [Paracoccus shanxieyensis]